MELQGIVFGCLDSVDDGESELGHGLHLYAFTKSYLRIAFKNGLTIDPRWHYGTISDVQSIETMGLDNQQCFSTHDQLS